MLAFAKAWPDAEFVQEVLAQLPWYRQLALLDKLPGPVARRWYTAKAIELNWAHSILVMQIEARPLELSGKLVTNFTTSLPKMHSDLAHVVVPRAILKLNLHHLMSLVLIDR